MGGIDLVNNLFLKEEMDDVVKSQLILSKDLEEIKNENKVNLEKVSLKIDEFNNIVDKNNLKLDELRSKNLALKDEFNNKIDILKDINHKTMIITENRLNEFKINQDDTLIKFLNGIKNKNEEISKRIVNLEKYQNDTLKQMSNEIYEMINENSKKINKLENTLNTHFKNMEHISNACLTSISNSQKKTLDNVESYFKKINNFAWVRFGMVMFIIIAGAAYCIYKNGAM